MGFPLSGSLLGNMEIMERNNKEDRKMNRKYKYEIRQLDAWGNKIDGYEINTSYFMGTMETAAENEKRAFTRYLARKHGIIFKKNRTRIDFDGDCYTILDRKTQEPLFIAIPNY